MSKINISFNKEMKRGVRRRGASVLSDAKIKKLEREHEAFVREQEASRAQSEQSAVVESSTVGSDDTNGQV